MSVPADRLGLLQEELEKNAVQTVSIIGKITELKDKFIYVQTDGVKKL
jgi:hypothetical protein